MSALSSLFLCVLAVQSATAQEFGTVAKSDGSQFTRFTIPQVGLLGDGRLFSVFGVSSTSVKHGRVFGAFSSDSGKTWTKPRLLVEDPPFSTGDPNMLVDGNTVWVFATKVKTPNDIKKAWTLMIKSTDNGATWSQPKELFIPRQYTPGKQHNGIKLRDGSYAMGISWDRWAEKNMNARTEGEMDLSSGLLLSLDGENWTLHGDLHAPVHDKIRPGFTNGLAEPSIVQLDNGELYMLLRHHSTHHYESRSKDGGLSWSKPQPSALTGSNTPVALLRLQGQPDIVAVWNSNPLQRYPLVTALSKDGGRTWSKPRILANGRVASYPGLTQLPDGSIFAVWQEVTADNGRDIRSAKFTRDWLLSW